VEIVLCVYNLRVEITFISVAITFVRVKITLRVTITLCVYKSHYACIYQTLCVNITLCVWTSHYAFENHTMRVNIPLVYVEMTLVRVVISSVPNCWPWIRVCFKLKIGFLPLFTKWRKKKINYLLHIMQNFKILQIFSQVLSIISTIAAFIYYGEWKSLLSALFLENVFNKAILKNRNFQIIKWIISTKVLYFLN
jgi:hypothetical protein